MRNAHRLKSLVLPVALALSVALPALRAQADLQSTVRTFLQAWYVDKKTPDELKSFIAKDNGFSLQPAGSANRATTSRAADPVETLFKGAFVPPKVGERIEPLKGLSEAIARPPKNANAPEAKGVSPADEFAIYAADKLPKGSYLPAKKPEGNDPVANYLYHLTQAYKGKLYVVLYAVKGPGMLAETAVTYWIQENGAWKLAAFMGTNG
jgi:hypothetical protein